MKIVTLRCQIVRGAKLSAVPNCPGAKLSYNPYGDLKQPKADPQANPAATNADYGRPRKTIANQAIVMSAVLPASLMHFFTR